MEREQHCSQWSGRSSHFRAVFFWGGSLTSKDFENLPKSPPMSESRRVSSTVGANVPLSLWAIALSSRPISSRRRARCSEVMPPAFSDDCLRFVRGSASPPLAILGVPHQRLCLLWCLDNISWFVTWTMLLRSRDRFLLFVCTLVHCCVKSGDGGNFPVSDAGQCTLAGSGVRLRSRIWGSD